MTEGFTLALRWPDGAALRRILSFTAPLRVLVRTWRASTRGRNFSFTIFCTETWRKNLQNKFPGVGDKLGGTNHHQNQTFKMHLFRSFYFSSFFSSFSLLMLVQRDQRIFIHQALLGHLTKLTLKLIYHCSHIKIIALTHGQMDISSQKIAFHEW